MIENTAVKKLSKITLSSNGRTTGFGPVNGSSNLSGVTKKRYYIMNLTKALKHKKKLVKQADEMYTRFQRYNSQNKENVDRGYDPAKAYESWLKLTNELVDLKTKIHNANAPIASKIFRLGEVKNLVSRLRNVDTKVGLVRESRYSDSEPVEYVAFMNLFTKDEIVASWEQEIETIQEEIEAFNAITKI